MKSTLGGLFSTALSGLSNVLFQILAATVLPASEYGLFAISAATLLFTLGLSRAMISQVDIIRGSRALDKGSVSASYGLAGILAIFGSSLYLILDGSPIFRSIAAGIAVSAVFILQDNLRFRAFRMGRGSVSFLSDIILFVASIGFISAVGALGFGSWVLVVAVWGLAALSGFLVGAIYLRYLPAGLIFGGKWVLRHRDLSLPGVGEFLLQSSLPYVLNFVILAVSGVDALAGYRLVQMLFAGVGNIASGLNATLIPKLVEARSPVMAQKHRRIEGATLSFLSLVVLILISTIPNSAGFLLFEDNWLHMQPFVIVGAVHSWANALSVPTYALLRVLGLANFSFLVRLISVPVSAVLAAGAATVGGAVLVAWSVAIPAVVSFLVRDARASKELRRLIHRGKDLQC